MMQPLVDSYVYNNLRFGWTVDFIKRSYEAA